MVRRTIELRDKAATTAITLASLGLFMSGALAGPLPVGGTTPISWEQTLEQLHPSAERAPSGLYAIESQLNFNVLDAVSFDPATERISLVGHFDQRYQGRRIPYLQHLAALLEMRDSRHRVRFTLTTDPASAQKLNAKIEKTPYKHETFLSHYPESFDQNGVVTHLGAAILISLGLSPVAGHRPPGYLGATVEALPSGAVRVTAVQAYSPADDANLRAGDEITKLNGKVPFSPGEFARLVRFAGAGTRLAVSYVRNGAAKDVAAALLPDPIVDPWNQATHADVDAELYRVAGQAERARAAYLAGVLASHIDAAATRVVVLAELGRALGAAAEIDRALAASPRGQPVAATVEAEVARQAFRRLGAVFDLSGDPVAQAFDAEYAGSQRLDRAIGAALKAFEAGIRPTATRMRDFAFDNPAGFQIPAELAERVFGEHMVSKPDYFGESPNSQIARVMLEADYIVKNMFYRPDLKERLPGYQTEFEYDIAHSNPAANGSEFRTWLSVDKMDVAESASGTTLVIRDARMRFNTRRLAADGSDVNEPPVAGYVDILNKHYDDLAADYFVLHEAREAAKLAAVASWLHKKKPDFHLPKEGRVSWPGPTTVPGVTYLHARRKGADRVIFSLSMLGGVSLTPVPAGSVALVIPMDRGAPELNKQPRTQTPSPDVGRAALSAPGQPASAPPAAAWTYPTLSGGRLSQGVTVNPKAADPEMAGLKDAVASKKSVADEEAALQRKIAQERDKDRKATYLYQLAWSKHDRGDNDDAIKLIKQAKELSPDNATRLLLQAQTEKESGNRPGAIEALKKYVAIDPGNGPAQKMLATLEADQKNNVVPPAPRPLSQVPPPVQQQPLPQTQPGPAQASRPGQQPGQPVQQPGQPSGQQAGRPQTGQPQTGQPQTGQPQPGQPQTGQPRPGQPQPGQPPATRPQPGPSQAGVPLQPFPQNGPRSEQGNIRQIGDMQDEKAAVEAGRCFVQDGCKNPIFDSIRKSRGQPRIDPRFQDDPKVKAVQGKAVGSMQQAMDGTGRWIEIDNKAQSGEPLSPAEQQEKATLPTTINRDGQQAGEDQTKQQVWELKD